MIIYNKYTQLCLIKISIEKYIIFLFKLRLKMTFIEIEGRKIGEGHKPLIIPEIGINHGVDLDVAYQMVDAAYKSGMIIKHQTVPYSG